tara:strand:- start:675 stop:1910 length:1236 start_codon:yes stop_codon:yes gene_type:complete
MNKKSPLKQVNYQDSSVVKNYEDAIAAQGNIKSNWDYVSDLTTDVSGVFREQQELKKLEEERKKLELEAYEDQFSKNSETIAMNAGSLGTEYYNLAFSEAEQLKKEYLDAQQRGDKQKMGELKMRLNGLSTSVQSLKETLNLAAELKNENELSNGRTDEEKMIAAVCTDPTNIVYHEGEWKWKNPKYNPEVEGSKEFITQDDFNNSLVIRDDATSASYREHESSMNELGYNYVNGVEGAADFDYERMKVKNLDWINQDNIMSIMHDDFRGTGDSTTFKSQVQEYLDRAGYNGLGIDVNKDGVYNEEDYDSPADMKILLNAITDKDSDLYDFNTSRNIIAGWLTDHQKNSFYGNANPDLVPVAGETIEQFRAKGGIVGKYYGSTTNGMTYDPELGVFIRETDVETIKKNLGY